MAQIFAELEKQVVEGNTGIEVNKYANFLCKRYGVRPAFLNYQGSYPYTICANLNEIIVHGFPTNKKFKNGDIFGLDMGIVYKGMNLDMSSTIVIGEVDPEIKKFVEKTKKSMEQGIAAAVPGNTIGDISAAMREGLVGEDFQLMSDFIGHGIGEKLHEKPDIPGDGMKKGEGITVEPGMVFAIESISAMGPTNDYEISSDGWTAYTKGKKYLSALFEQTVIVAEEGPEIVTEL